MRPLTRAMKPVRARAERIVFAALHEGWQVGPALQFLVLDDDEVVAEVDVVAPLEEALVLAVENPPDLVVLDWMLPKAPGIEVCRRLRARQETRNTPIVMLTARTEETDRIRGLDVGADD